MGGRSDQLVSDLIGRVREEVSAAASRNRFVDLLEAGGVPRERLTWLAGEQFRIVGSDRRSFALLAARFPDPPAGDMFLRVIRNSPVRAFTDLNLIVSKFLISARRA